MNLKQLMNQVYPDAPLNEIRMKRIEKNIFAKIDSIENKQQRRVFAYSRVAALFLFTVLSYTFMSQILEQYHSNQVEVFISEIENKMESEIRIEDANMISYKSKEDLLIAIANEQLQKMDTKETMEFAGEVF